MKKKIKVNKIKRNYIVIPIDIFNAVKLKLTSNIASIEQDKKINIFLEDVFSTIDVIS